MDRVNDTYGNASLVASAIAIFSTFLFYISFVPAALCYVASVNGEMRRTM